MHGIEYENRIEGAGVDVHRLRASSVMIKIGDCPKDEVWRHPAWNVIRGLSRLGIGSLELHGASQYFELLEAETKETPFLQVVGPWILGQFQQLDSPVDLLIDMSNSHYSRNLSATLASCYSIPSLFVSWGTTCVSVQSLAGRSCKDQEPPSEESELPMLPVARIASGMVLQETLRYLGVCGGAEVPQAEVIYDTADESRVERSSGHWPPLNLEDVVIDVIGAGGTGTQVLESFAPLLNETCTVRIFDPDTVGVENLAMQLAYRIEDVGRPKAEVMARELREHSSATLEAYATNYQDRPSTLSAASLRVLCPDNFMARYLANCESQRDGIPLLDIGSSPHAARVDAYIPGKTACLEHRLTDLANKAGEEQSHASCELNTAPTLPGTNMICAGIAASEALRVLRPDLYGDCTRGRILYDMRFPARFGIVDRRPACQH